MLKSIGKNHYREVKNDEDVSVRMLVRMLHLLSG